MRMSFSLPKPPQPVYPTPSEFELLAKTACELADERDLLRRKLSRADEIIGQLRAGDRSPVEMAQRRRIEELLEANADLDERNAGLRLENETVVRERDDAVAHLTRLVDGVRS